MKFKEWMESALASIAAGKMQRDLYPPTTFMPPQQGSAGILHTGERQKLLPPGYDLSYKNFKRRVEKMGVGKVKKVDVKQPDGSIERQHALHPKLSKNVPRNKMPQLKDRQDFLRWLTSNNVPVKKENITAKSLWKKNGKRLMAHAQSMMYLQKAYKFVRKNTLLDKDILVTQDGIIFDGNHHWLGIVATHPDTPVPMYKIGMDFEPLKQLTVDNYPGVSFQESFMTWYSRRCLKDDACREDF